MRRHKMIDIGQGGLHALAQGAVFIMAQQGIQPQDPVGLIMQAFHFFCHDCGVTSVPTIAENYNDCS